MTIKNRKNWSRSLGTQNQGSGHLGMLLLPRLMHEYSHNSHHLPAIHLPWSRGCFFSLDEQEQNYCWWTKSCIGWYGKYSMSYRVLYTSGACLGFLPSTVVKVIPNPCEQGSKPLWHSTILFCKKGFLQWLNLIQSPGTLFSVVHLQILDDAKPNPKHVPLMFNKNFDIYGLTLRCCPSGKWRVLP